jgi:type II secretory pathway pseudopilin PulG
MRGALIVGGVALVGAGALWLWSQNRAKAEAAAARQAANIAAAARRERARSFLSQLAANPLLRAQTSPAIILQNEVNAGVNNRATAGNMSRAFELNYTAGAV